MSTNKPSKHPGMATLDGALPMTQYLTADNMATSVKYFPTYHHPSVCDCFNYILNLTSYKLLSKVDASQGEGEHLQSVLQQFAVPS